MQMLLIQAVPQRKHVSEVIHFSSPQYGSSCYIFGAAFEAEVYADVTYSGRTSKKTRHFTITEINWLMLSEEFFTVYSENHTKPINTKCRIIGRSSR
jgi:hypothetical protein